jgi:hypothetical protein
VLARCRVVNHAESLRLFLLFCQPFPDQLRGARWHIFRPKIPISVNFGGP